VQILSCVLLISFCGLLSSSFSKSPTATSPEPLAKTFDNGINYYNGDVRTSERLPKSDIDDISGNAQTNASVLKIFAHAHFLKTILWLARHFAHLALPAHRSKSKQAKTKRAKSAHASKPGGIGIMKHYLFIRSVQNFFCIIRQKNDKRFFTFVMNRLTPKLFTMKKITNLTGSSFLPLIAIILLIKSSPTFAQTYWNNQGAKIYIGGKGVITGTNTTVVSDSNTVIVNHGTIKVTEMQNQGTLEMKDTSARLIIDSMLLLEKGRLTLNGTLIILSDDTLALQITDGQIVAENSTSKIRWHTGVSTGKYVLPFFTKNQQSVKVILNVLNAGSGEGNFEVRTFPSNPNSIPNNRSYPSELSTYADTSTWFNSSLHTADRYWKVSANNYNSNPVSNLALTYTNDNIGGENTIQEEQLFALQWNGTDWDTLAGTVDTTGNTYHLDSLNNYSVLILRDADTTCPVIANFTSSANAAYLGDELTFTNTSVNATSFQWRINNGVVSEDSDYTYYFRATGKYIVTLVAENDSCKSIHNKVFDIKRRPRPDLNQTAHSWSEPLSDSLGTVTIPPMYAYDRLGNEYLYEDLRIPNNTMVAGIFMLHFFDEDNGLTTGFNDPATPVNTSNCNPPCDSLGEERRWLVARVFEDLSELLCPGGNPVNLPQPYPGDTTYVEISVRSNTLPDGSPLPAGALGVGSSFYSYEWPGILYGDIWKTIVGGWDAYYNMANAPFPPAPMYHGFLSIRFNGSTDWYTSISGSPAIGANQVDLYTVVLHEVLHALGFASLINQNGSGLQNTPRYSLFDTYLNLNDSVPLLSSTNNFCYDVDLNVSQADLAPDCGAITFNGTGADNSNQEIHSPSSWQQGSSLSHFNCDSVSGCALAGNGFVMNFCAGIDSNSIQRFLHDAEVQTLCDLGYNIQDTFGSGTTLHTYTNACPANNPNGIAGLNDFGYTVQAGQTITFTSTGTNNILANDFNADEIACVERLFPAGTLTSSSDTVRFTPDVSYTGPAVLRYRPYNSVNNRYGNSTFIFLQVLLPPLPACEPNDCELICNGDFEAVTNFIVKPLSELTITNVNSPDIYPRPFGLNPIGLCGNNTTPQPDSTGGNKYIGMIKDSLQSNVEVIFFDLVKPLKTNRTYVLSFIGRKISNLCPLTYVYGLNYLFSENRPCFLPTPFCLTNGCNTNCGSYTFEATVLPNSTFNVNAANWTSYTDTFTIPSNSPDLNFFILYRTGTNGSYIYLDNVSLTEINTVPIKITGSISDDSPCSGDTVTLTYQLCIDNQNGDVTNTDSVNLELTLTEGLAITGGDFDEDGGFTIPANGLDTVCDYTLTADILLETVIPGLNYDAHLITTGGACVIDAGSDTTLTIVPATELSIEISTEQGGTTFSPFDTVTFNIVVCNPSSIQGATDIVVRDSLPSGFTFISGLSPDFSLNSGLLSSASFGLSVNSCDTVSFTVSLADTCAIINNCAFILEGEGSCDIVSDYLPINIAGAGAVLFPLHSPGDSIEQAHGIATDGNGNFYVAGVYTGTFDFPIPFNKPEPTGAFEMFLAKYASCNAVDWVVNTNTLQATSSITAEKVQVDNNGNVIVAGHFRDSVEFTGTGAFKDTLVSNSGSFDLFVAKYDSDGELIWVIRDGDQYQEEVENLAVGGQNSAVVVGFYYTSTTLDSQPLSNAGTGGTNGFIVKYDSTGNGQWASELDVLLAGGSSPYEGFARGVGIYNDSVFIAGELDGDVYVEKFDPGGNSVLNAVYPRGTANDLAVDADGNFIITGEFGTNLNFGGSWELGSTGDNPDAFAAKFSSAGTVQWAYKFGGDGSPLPLAMAANDSGHVIITGAFTTGMEFFEDIFSAGSEDIFVAKFDSAGTKKWIVTAGSTGSDKPQDIISGSNSDYLYLTGVFRDAITFNTTLTTSGGKDFFAARIQDYQTSAQFAKMSPLENPADENNESSETATEYFFSVYPNPADNTITIETDYPSPLDLILFDLVGKEQRQETIVSKKQILNLKKLNEGVFLYALKAADTNAIVHQGKLLIIR